jgi:hypothetical protein
VTPRAQLLAGGALALAALLFLSGYALGARKGQGEAAQAIQESSVLKGQVHALTQESASHAALAGQAGQAAKDQTPVIAEIKTRLARIHQQGPGSQPAGPAQVVDGHPGAGSGDDGSEAALTAQLIEAQDRKIGALETEVSELHQALDAQERATEVSEQRGDRVQAALAKVADPRNRAFGLVWGQRTKGFTAEMDMGPLRVGMDVVRRPNETEAVGRVLWRF